MIRDNTSAARDLVEIIWSNNQQATKSHNERINWDILNHTMSDAVMLAIRAGLRFHSDDFEYFDQKLRISYWGGSSIGNSTGEFYYAEGVKTGNISACRAFEKWQSRKPFTLDRKRIYIGREFMWHEEKVICTSFAEDNSYVTACSYHDKYEENSRRKIKRRYKITQKDLKNYKKGNSNNRR